MERDLGPFGINVRIILKWILNMVYVIICSRQGLGPFL